LLVVLGTKHHEQPMSVRPAIPSGGHEGIELTMSPDKEGESCGAVEVGGDVYNLNVNDFGPESVDGWLDLSRRS
jgi:hypothetical protein